MILDSKITAGNVINIDFYCCSFKDTYCCEKIINIYYFSIVILIKTYIINQIHYDKDQVIAGDK